MGDTMRVTVHLWGPLVKFRPPGVSGKRFTVELPPGATVADLADKLGMGEDDPAVVMVNDAQHHYAGILYEGDEVSFFPPLAGG